jgi:hypothetical protein
MTAVLVGVAVVVVYVLLCTVSYRLYRADFEKRFPPISDAEFLARCHPGTRPEVALKVRRIVAEQLGVEYERLYPTTSFVEDIGAG